MAAPAELRRSLRVGTDTELGRYQARSHLGDGRVVAWTGAAPGPDERVAVDAELEGPVPAALAARFGERDFWARWTRLECVAKLIDVPVVVLLRDGLDAPPVAGLRLATVRLEGRGGPVVSVGRLLGAPPV